MWKTRARSFSCSKRSVFAREEERRARRRNPHNLERRDIWTGKLFSEGEKREKFHRIWKSEREEEEEDRIFPDISPFLSFVLLEKKGKIKKS